MSFAVIHDLAVSWERYRRAAAAVAPGHTAGLLVYAAGPTEEGVRILALWQDEAAWRRFEAGRLAQSLDALDGPPVAPAVQRAWHAKHLVVSPAAALSAAASYTTKEKA